MLDSALYYMENLAALYPTSVHTPQAWMYCGEYNFDRGELDQAIKCYQATMRYPESEWFDEALYKLAQAQYRLSNPEKAISSFLALVVSANPVRQTSGAAGKRIYGLYSYQFQ